MLTSSVQIPHLAVTAGQGGTFGSLNSDHLLNPLNMSQRLAKWFTTLSPKDKAKIIKDVSQLVLARRTRMCNFLEYKGMNKQSLVTCPVMLG
jgi:hypothetical protein